MSECNSTVFNSLRSLFWSSSTLAPEINETYPGTSGNTHGDKNETIPARNAVIGKGNEDIGLSQLIQTKDVLHCNLVTDFLIAGKSRKGAASGHLGGAEMLSNELKLLNRLSDFQPLAGRKRPFRTDYKLLKVSGFFLGAGFFSGIVSSMMIFFTP
jgi:hypothetical protein